MPTTAWLIGSRYYPASTITVTANTVQTVLNVAAGNYYLYDSADARSLLAAIETAIESHAQITTCTAYMMRNRLVHVEANVAFSIDAWGNAQMRDDLGFAGTLSSSTSHNATLVSPLLWSPGKPESVPNGAPVGSQGVPRTDSQQGSAGTGYTTVTNHNSYRVNEFEFRFVDNSRVMTSSEAGGEHIVFWEQVLRRAGRFNLWRNVSEDTSSTSQVTLSTKLGPYVKDRIEPEYPYNRAIRYYELLNNIDLDVKQVAEFS